MIIPIGDENPRGRAPLATLAIIAAIVYAWFAVQGWRRDGLRVRVVAV